MTGWVVALAWWAGSPSVAASGEELNDCLLRYDVPCAEEQIAALKRFGSGPELLAAEAEVAFYAGRYPEAHDLLEQAVAAGFPDRNGDLELYRRTMFATAGWVEERRGRFVVRWRPGLDDLLVDEAFDALMRAEQHLAPVLGGAPPGETILELYPDARSFIAASSLLADDVYTTGTVALSKWSRLLVTSPRTRGYGYDWQDTIAHEYIHLVVAYRGSGDAPVPVWLQEGIAKYLDNRWQDGTDGFVLSVRQKGALADAIRRKELVTFEEMHPSLAKLPTAERSALAYAQLATLVQFAFERGGDDVLIDTLTRTRRGEDPRVALAEAVGAADFATLEAEWLAWLSAQDLDGAPLDELPAVLDGGEDTDLDPAIAADRRLAEFVDLGDLLVKYDEHEAALVEYTKAVPEGEAPSPLLANRMARAHLALDQAQPAQALLERSLEDYPDFPMTYKTMGQVHEARGRPAGARPYYEEVLRYNPFDPEARTALARVARASGDEALAKRHEAILERQRRGGSDDTRPPIHTRVGTYELPRLDEHTRATAPDEPSPWIGKAAPSYLALDLEGREIDPKALLGKVVLVDFWATWCGPCRAAMPALDALHQARSGDGLVVVGLTDEPEPKVAGFLAKSPVKYRIGVRAGDVKDRFGVEALPTAFVIGRDGRVVDVVVGAGEGAHARLQKAVERALAER